MSSSSWTRLRRASDLGRVIRNLSGIFHVFLHYRSTAVMAGFTGNKALYGIYRDKIDRFTFFLSSRAPEDSSFLISLGN
jgi:hypothetical protein